MPGGCCVVGGRGDVDEESFLGDATVTKTLNTVNANDTDMLASYTNNNRDTTTGGPLGRPKACCVPRLPSGTASKGRLGTNIVNYNKHNSNTTRGFLSTTGNIAIITITSAFGRHMSTLTSGLGRGKYGVPRSGHFINLSTCGRLVSDNISIIVVTAPPMFHPMRFRCTIRGNGRYFLRGPVYISPMNCHAVVTATGRTRTGGLYIMANARHRRRHGCIRSCGGVVRNTVNRVANNMIC